MRHHRCLSGGALIAALGATCAFAAGQSAPDPYAPLQLYAGKWSVRDSAGGSHAIDNHCARTGLFFVCEQVVDGKPGALVVFLPTGAERAGLTYRNIALTAEGKGSPAWGPLVIQGDRWTYGGGDGERTLNRFSGPDHIHFDVQSSKDGKTWTTTLSGEESRVR